MLIKVLCDDENDYGEKCKFINNNNNNINK